MFPDKLMDSWYTFDISGFPRIIFTPSGELTKCVNNKIIHRAKLDIKPDECLLSALLLYKYIAINGKAITMLSFAEIAAARRAPEILNLA